MNEISRISIIFSYLGWLFLNGSVEVAKYFYRHIWEEYPPLIRTISELQECLPSVRIISSSYSPEFLYYWGMICLGEQSPLIPKELGIAETCFHIIKDAVPQAEARLAYIKLLQSNSPAKSSENLSRLEVLRQWACRQDLFSRIVLSKISCYNFLCEEQPEGSGLPVTALRLLELPLQEGHPVAIQLWKDICTCIGTTERSLVNSHVDASKLYDFKTPSNMQIWP